MEITLIFPAENAEKAAKAVSGNAAKVKAAGTGAKAAGTAAGVAAKAGAGAVGLSVAAKVGIIVAVAAAGAGGTYVVDRQVEERKIARQEEPAAESTNGSTDGDSAAMSPASADTTAEAVNADPVWVAEPGTLDIDGFYELKAFPIFVNAPLTSSFIDFTGYSQQWDTSVYKEHDYTPDSIAVTKDGLHGVYDYEGNTLYPVNLQARNEPAENYSWPGIYYDLVFTPCYASDTYACDYQGGFTDDFKTINPDLTRFNGGGIDGTAVVYQGKYGMNYFGTFEEEVRSLDETTMPTDFVVKNYSDLNAGPDGFSLIDPSGNI